MPPNSQETRCHSRGERHVDRRAEAACQRGMQPADLSRRGPPERAAESQHRSLDHRGQPEPQRYERGRHHQCGDQQRPRGELGYLAVTNDCTNRTIPSTVNRTCVPISTMRSAIVPPTACASAHAALLQQAGDDELAADLGERQQVVDALTDRSAAADRSAKRPRRPRPRDRLPAQRRKKHLRQVKGDDGQDPEPAGALDHTRRSCRSRNWQTARRPVRARPGHRRPLPASGASRD